LNIVDTLLICLLAPHPICKKLTYITLTPSHRDQTLTNSSKLEEHYKLSYTAVSLVFLSPIGGYTLAALTNNFLHLRFGRRGIAILSPGCHLIAYIVNCLHPPYPVLVVSFIFAGLGNGLADSAWNAWIGNMADSNQVLGLLHGWYGLGAVLAPLVATSLITEAKVGWWYFYYIMVRLYITLSVQLGLTCNRSRAPQ
jgi:fucose permease